MKKRMNPVTILSQCIIWAVVIILTLSCLLPLLNMVAISFSGSDAVAANEVGLIPKISMSPPIRSCWETPSSGDPS